MQNDISMSNLTLLKFYFNKLFLIVLNLLKVTVYKVLKSTTALDKS